MSTGSFVVIKVAKEMKGKEVKFTLNGQWDSEKHEDVKGKEITIKVPKTKKYMGIYVHWDGYPSGVGTEVAKIPLNELTDTMYKGDRSSLAANDMESALYLNRGEKNVMPHFFKDLKEAVQYAANSWCKYVYFKTENRTYGISIYNDCEIENSKGNQYKKIVLNFHGHELIEGEDDLKVEEVSFS